MRLGLDRKGTPSSWLFCVMLIISWMGMLKKDWCMDFNWFYLYGMVYKLLAVWCT